MRMRRWGFRLIYILPKQSDIARKTFCNSLYPKKNSGIMTQIHNINHVICTFHIVHINIKVFWYILIKLIPYIIRLEKFLKSANVI